MKTKIIAEIGINHNGDINLAKKLIDAAELSGCDYVKFQKRTPELCVPKHQKYKLRQTPWGEMTYIDYKHKIEFGKKEYDELFHYVATKNVDLFASVWDTESVDFMANYTGIMKIPSALINDLKLCEYTREKSNCFIISTGMSTESQIEACVKRSDPDIIMHTNSTYPTPVNEINLAYISWLKDKWKNKEIGYSGHEYGLVTTFAAVSMGATWVERHVTLDRTMWGSDQLASVEPQGLMKLCKGIRDIEKALGACAPREVFPGELAKLDSLRK